MEVQQRLFDLGYLASRPDGKWGPRSAGALQTFRHASKLADETAWDKATEDLLLSAPSVSRPATPIAFVGNWRTEAGSCGLIGEAPPLRITNTAAETAGGRCDFESVRPEPDGSWRVRARCVVGGEAWQANIQLRLLSNRLTWSSERGKAQYLRCR
jgi:peptidoglycan hydrolase-like protein with peptidoglycan-binding domain